MLHRELADAVRRARREDDAAWLANRGARCVLLGSATIRACRGGFYEPDPAGFRAFVFPILERAHLCAAHGIKDVAPRDLVGDTVALLDLAAWRPSEPDVILLRRGEVAALGEWSLDPTLAGDDPLHLWATPLAWAVADFAGAVVIDWASAAPQVLEWGQIICDSVSLGEMLQRELRKVRRRIVPRLPKIGVLVDENVGAT